jgi:small conductance mechanosensitive channel
MTTWLEQPIIGGTSLLDIVLFLLVMGVAVILARKVSSFVRKHLDDTVGKRSSKGVARLLQYAILAVALLLSSNILLHVDLNTVILSLGVVGVAVAFATQQVIQNAVAGILISITKPIKLEDWVEVGSTPSTGICRVRDIRLMSTELRERGGRITIIPNSQIINGKVINYTRSGFTSLTRNIWVAPNTDLCTVRRIVLEEADRDPYILPEVSEGDKAEILSIFDRYPLKDRCEPDQQVLGSLCPTVNVVDIQASRVKLQINVWVKDVQHGDEIMSGLLEALKARFEDEGIELKDP